MEVILSVRQLGERTAPNLAIWAAHSEADVTTPIQGTEALLKRNAGTSEFFRIEKDVSLCHADLVLNDTQVAHMSKDRSATDVSLMCNGPKANPKHQQMLDSMHRFINKL